MGVRRVIPRRADIPDEVLEREVLKRLSKDGDYAGEVLFSSSPSSLTPSFLNKLKPGQIGMSTTVSLVVMIMSGHFRYVLMFLRYVTHQQKVFVGWMIFFLSLMSVRELLMWLHPGPIAGPREVLEEEE